MATPTGSPSPSPSAEVALERLREGNRRFVARESIWSQQGWRPGLAEGQLPFAVVLGCSDSRAPAELVFDQGLGDLFVIRVAGNVVAPSGVGSVEFAAAQFGTQLVVVMGHTQCGAVSATLRTIQGAEASSSKNIRSITDRIRPHIEPLAKSGALTGEALLREGVRANIAASVDALRHGSALLEELILSHRITVVGAEYDLETGAVGFMV